MPSPLVLMRSRGCTLREQFEHARMHVARDADAVVTHRNLDLSRRLLAHAGDVPARRRVLRRVVEQVPKHLRQPRGRLRSQRCFRNVDLQPVFAGLDRGLNGLERIVEHAAQGDALVAQIDLATVMRETSMRSSTSRTM